MQADFGVRTRAGEGGVAVPGAGAIVSGDPAGHWQISGGKLSPSATGAGNLSGAYDLELDTGTTVGVTVVANGRTVATSAELWAIVDGGVSVAAGETIWLRRGPFNTAGMTFSGQPSNVTYAPADPLVPWEVDRWWMTTGTIENVTLRGFLLTKPYNYETGTPWAPEGLTVASLVNLDNAGIDGLTLEDFVIDGQLEPASGRSIIIPTQSNGCIYARGANNITIRRGILRHARSGITLNGCQNVLVEDNTLSDFWTDSFILQNGAQDLANIVIRNNHSNGVAGNPSGFHMDWIQFQPQGSANTAMRDILIEGNTHAAGLPHPFAQTDPEDSLTYNIYTATQDLPLSENGQEVRVNHSGTITLTLPSAVSNPGVQFVVRRTSGTGTTDFAYQPGEDHEDGALSLTATGDFATFVSDGTAVWKKLPYGYRPWMMRRTASQTLGAAEAGKVVFVDAVNGDVDLTLPSGGDQAFSVQRIDATANTVRVRAASGDTIAHHTGSETETGIGFVQGYGCTFTGNGAGGWTTVESKITNQGLFSNRHTFGFAAGDTLGADQDGHLLHVNAGSGLSIDLPANGDQTYIFQRDRGVGDITLSPAAGDSITLDGAVVGSVTISDSSTAVAVAGDGAGTWVATSGPDRKTGNAPTALIRDITIRGNILANLGSAVLIEQDVPGMRLYNNTRLPMLYADANGDGALNRYENAADAQGEFRATGASARSWSNVTVGRVTTVFDGGAGQDLGSIALNRGDMQGPLTDVLSHWAGTSRADFRPTTRAEVIAAALAQPGGPLDGTQTGAVGTTASNGYYDFEAGQVNPAQPVPGIVSAIPADGANIGTDSAFQLTFDQFMELGAGAIVLRNVTDNQVIETFAAGAGDKGGTVTVSGPVVTITPGADLPGMKTVALRIAADALTGHYGTAFAGFTDDTMLNVTTEVGVPTSFATVAVGGASSWTKAGAPAAQWGGSATTLLLGFQGTIADTAQSFQTVFGQDATRDVVFQVYRETEGRIVFGQSNFRVPNLMVPGVATKLLLSIDSSAATAAEGVTLYKDGTLVDPATFTSVNWSQGTALSGTSDPDLYVFSHWQLGRRWSGQAGFVYVDYPATLPDLASAAVRARFTPGEIGADGSGPTGARPALYMTGDAAAWSTGDQLGAGGGFTVTGAFSDA